MTSFYLRYDKHHLSYDFYDGENIIEENMRLGDGQAIRVLNDWFGEDRWGVKETISNTEAAYYEIYIREQKSPK